MSEDVSGLYSLNVCLDGVDDDGDGIINVVDDGASDGHISL